ncbi:hypothetical protein CMUS01_15448 [Colletotrichum musicola]|uniref:Suppressor protein SRP40 n=1 Tax=Colletotrichum musicola TaxID=2175873 RepID=A0A8H6IWQ7_9PEZI|nr:hypothetical protein CMUS01_15448 [Colletotrichum musicola]
MPPNGAATTTSDPAVPSDASSAYTRLHITPFDQDLVKVVIPSAILPRARNISYHTIETFPERRYGYVELPEADAEKVKKRLNGAVLKGTKMRIETARPEKSYLPVAGEEETGKKRKKDSKDKEERTKKRKRDHNLVEGVELKDRKVKRGWTVPEEAKIREKKSKKDKEKKEKKDKHKKREERSKYTDKEECLLKTKLPAKLPAATPADADEEEVERKKRKKSKSREVVIHEFEKTTKFPTFLKATKPAPAESLTTEFVEGKGWVDAEGNVIEQEKIKRTASAPVPETDTPKKKKKKAAKEPTPPPPPQDDDTSSSGTSSDEDTSSDESSDEEEQVKAQPVTPAKKKKAEASTAPPPVEDDTTSSSGSSSDDSSSDSDSDDEMEDADKAAAPTAVESPLAATRAADASRPKSSSSNVSLTIKIPPATPAQVHPLEALYKRPKPDGKSTPNPAAEAEPFSFFGAGGDNDDIEEEEDAAPHIQMPMTPFTEEEFKWRNIRSAAPTPDTAHPNHTKPFWAIGAEDEEDEDEDEEETREEVEATLNAERNAAAEDNGPGGDFQKWFWENRRNLNQSWMKRRKTAAKEKRHRDNKSRASKAV